MLGIYRQTTLCSGFYNNSKSNSLSCRSPRRISKTAPCLHETTRSDLKPKYQNQSTSWTTTPSPSPNTASTWNFQVKVSSIKMFLLLRANRKQAGPMHIWIYACIVYGYMYANVMAMQANKEPPCYVTEPCNQGSIYVVYRAMHQWSTYTCICHRFLHSI